MRLPPRREIELLALTAFAAVPLYLTRAVGFVPLIVFHVVLIGMIVRVARGKGPDLIPSSIMRVLAFAYIFLYFVDLFMSRSAIAASTRLVLFIAAYQPIESMRAHNLGQRLFTTALIFIASIATAVDITIVIFIVLFAYFMFRQLMLVSHVETARSIGSDYLEPPSRRAAAFYLVGTMVVAAALFPILPRVRNPLVQGLSGALAQTATGLSESIDFNRERTSPPDPTVVARVWMGQESVPFFTPLRLRGAVYNRYQDNVWRQARRRPDFLRQRGGTYRIARPVGFTRPATVEQRFVRETRLLLPAGTVAVRGVPDLVEGPAREVYTVPIRSFRQQNEPITYRVDMALRWRPRDENEAPSPTSYPVTPAVAAMAQRIVGTRTDPREQARAIEIYLLRNFRYFQRPEQIGQVMTVDEFLLRERRGHCEYFAAGMVALLTARNIPARIAGGFYGGQFNPLTGYFVIRRADAHAWVEMWDGNEWHTFDPTPASFRPGAADSNLLKMYASAIGESINYFWDRYVLTYGLADQITLAAEVITRGRDAASSVRQRVDNLAAAITGPRGVAVAAIAAAMALATFLIMRRRRRLSDLLAESMRRLGIEIGPAMTFEEALAELRAKHPDAAREMEPLIRMYEEETFSEKSQRERAAMIRRKLAELR
jgi:transglutaminase-like putative cysteine protease